MSKPEQPSTGPQEDLQKMMAEVEDSLRPMIGETNTESNRDAVAEKVASILHSGRQVGKAYPDFPGGVDVYTTWSRMGWKERCKWFLANRLFRWVGRDVRAYRDLVSRAYREEGDGPRIPDWAQDCPKGTLNVDAKVYLPLPADHIKVDVEIE